MGQASIRRHQAPSAFQDWGSGCRDKIGSSSKRAANGRVRMMQQSGTADTPNWLMAYRCVACKIVARRQSSKGQMTPRSRLTLKEQRFVDAYLGHCGGNATAAVRAAGYGATTANAQGVQGLRLLRKAKIEQAIKARTSADTRKSVLTAEARDERLSKLAMSPVVPPATQVSAIRELNICSGRHSIKHVLDVKETLASIIARSRVIDHELTWPRRQRS